ncbi:TetR family transcriptional regulator [Amycolatopsis antarctica]|uniref:TetR family transcriptional regulator n=1 Tax=Amycolatopsis antarctica TaxID=1854586 RepID=A0A263CVQ0_9PSEU|nr:TetR/AcrR family transcriptional regulator [Amycolatopsis antarctica]OZM70181.1 TetR family transcriptional regulator [Amycolatopsis antarctica]
MVTEDAFPALPRGRHNLSREQVADVQRQRLLFGMAAAVSEKGFAKTSVAEVLSRAKVSRETFYQHFDGKEACFLALLDTCSGILSTLIEGNLVASRSDDDPLTRFGTALEVYLRTLSEQVQIANVFFLEAPAAGPGARERRFDVQRRFTESVALNFREDPGWAAVPDPEFACQLLVAAISSLVVGKLAVGEAKDLPGLHEPIMALLRGIRDSRVSGEA